MVKNPVMFVVEVGAVLTTVLRASPTRRSSSGAIAVWLWLTVVFANLAEAVAEGRGKAQADTLRRAKTETTARRLRRATRPRSEVPATELRPGDLVVVEAGEIIPGDGDVIEGVAVVDESAITGESAPVIRESGGDRSAVTGGTKVLSDRIVVQITAEPGETLPRPDDRPGRGRGAAEDAERDRAEHPAGQPDDHLPARRGRPCRRSRPYAGTSLSIVILIALLVCLIPTTIGALLSAIGIAGHGPAGAAQRAGHVGPRGRGGG